MSDCMFPAVTSEEAKFSDRQPRQSDLSSGFRREMRDASPVYGRNDRFLCLQTRPCSFFLRVLLLRISTAPQTFVLPSHPSSLAIVYLDHSWRVILTTGVHSMFQYPEGAYEFILEFLQVRMIKVKTLILIAHL